MLVAKDRQTGMVFALPVERGSCGPADVLGSTQVTKLSDGELAVV